MLQTRSSSSCFDDFFEMLQQWSLYAERCIDHLTTQPAYLNDEVRVFKKEDKTRNNLACLDDEKKKNKNKKKKKLHLVLDLDHTHVHSILASDLSENEKYLLEGADPMLDIWIYDIDYSDDERIMKLRPFVHDFLFEANKLFIMHVYTMGNSAYAQMVLQLIDPDKVYFGDRVITREASPYNKTLDLLVVDKRRVVIVDDTIDVWPHDKRNLLQITRYIYFKVDDTKCKSYAEENKDESRRKGSLVNVLKFLKYVHKRFEEELDSKDLRLLIPSCIEYCF